MHLRYILKRSKQDPGRNFFLRRSEAGQNPPCALSHALRTGHCGAYRSGMAADAASLPLPALHASHGGCWLRAADGQTRATGKGEAIMAAADTPLLLLNAPLVATRLGYPDLSGLDLLELFAFVFPARFCVPTPKGLATALDIAAPAGDDAVPNFSSAPRGQCWPHAKAPLGRCAKGRGARYNRWHGYAGLGHRCSARISRSRNGPNAGCSPACPNGKTHPNAHSPRKCRSRRRISTLVWPR